jgi:hypothetical protein
MALTQHMYATAILSLELQNITPTSAVPTNVRIVKKINTKQQMTMTNASKNKDEGNNIGGWKQVGSSTATETRSANKTINGSET